MHMHMHMHTHTHTHYWNCLLLLAYIQLALPDTPYNWCCNAHHCDRGFRAQSLAVAAAVRKAEDSARKQAAVEKVGK